MTFHAHMHTHSKQVQQQGKGLAIQDLRAVDEVAGSKQRQRSRICHTIPSQTTEQENSRLRMLQMPQFTLFKGRLHKFKEEKPPEVTK